MFYLVKVYIGRQVIALDRPFSYYSLEEDIHQGMRVLVPFASSKETIGFVIEEPEKIEESLEEYQKKNSLKLAKITKKVDSEALLDDKMISLARKIADYYQTDLIKVLNTMLPPSLKPKNSALNKPQGKFATFVFANDISIALKKNEETLYHKIKACRDGVRLGKITAKKTLAKLLSCNALRKEEVPVSRIPQMEAASLLPFDLTLQQENAYQTIMEEKDRNIFLLEGVTGSGKTEVYIRLCETYLKNGKGVLVLFPEIALTDHMVNMFLGHFPESVSILNSSLSDSRKYDEYMKILHGESKIVLGTRSAVFAPVSNLGLIIIDEEHSSSYKQDSQPYYDAIEVAKMRCEENGKVVLGSATPRIIDRARAEKGLYVPVYMTQRYAKNQEKDLTIVDMNNSAYLNPMISSMISIPLQEEITKTLKAHQQAMILLNRRGYAPLFICRNCHQSALCPNCGIPLNYHRRDDTLRCHHCGYKVSSVDYTCSCKSHDFLTLGYGTEKVMEELKMLYPMAKIARLDSDVSNNEVRHELLESFRNGDTDILIGTQVIAKGHDFPRVTLAAMLDCDSSLRLPSYLANEETFDLICQFVGRTGRKDLKGRVLLQTYAPDNKTIQLAAKQDYEAFYRLEMEERRKYLYPPYVYLTQIIVKALDAKRCEEVAIRVKEYLLSAIGNRKFNVYGPSLPYIPHINGRYYRNILIKYKNPEEAKEVFRGLRAVRLANKDAEILINVDPGNEGF